MPFAAIVQRIRSFSLSIGQLTFAQLPAAAGDDRDDQRRQRRRHPPHRYHLCRAAAPRERRRPGRGDRPAHERAAAGGARLRDRSGGPSDRVWEAASALSALLKKTRLELAPEQQDMIDGVAATACELPRRNRARHRPDRAPRRTGRGLAAGARTVRSGDRRSARPGRRAATCFGRKTRLPRRCWRTIRGCRAIGAAHAGADDRRSRRFAPRPTPMPTRSSRYPARKARSPSSTRKCSAPKAGRSAGSPICCGT